MTQALNTEQSTNPQKRRRHTRIDLSASVSLNSDSNFYTGFTENISCGGVFVATERQAEPGTEVSLVIELPDGGEPIPARALVRWVREPNENNDVAPGFGAEFLNLSEASKKRINEFIATRQPIFFL